MHELGIVYEVVKIVDQFVKEQDLSVVDKIVLEIGQLSQAIPRFIEECYPAAVDETPYAATKLEIEVVEAIGQCKACKNTFNIIEHRKVCPNCKGEEFTLKSGREFNIKEIVAY